MIRDAEPLDLEPLCDMAERFVAETGLPYTFDYQATRELFWAAINDDDAILIVEDIDGILAGGIMGYEDRDFCVEKNAYITKLYVEKEYRGRTVARNLLKGFLAKVSTPFVFSSATAGMGERVENLYVNLFKKEGFEILGRILVRYK